MRFTANLVKLLLGGSLAFVGYVQTGAAQFNYDTITYSTSIAKEANFENYFIAASTNGVLLGKDRIGNFDAQLIKLDLDGKVLASQVVGKVGASTTGDSVATGPASGVVLAGSSTAVMDPSYPFPAGLGNAYVTSFDSVGSLTPLWTRQLSAVGQYTNASGTVVDVAGFVYLVGTTTGSIEGLPKIGVKDSFFARYHPNGTRTNLIQFGAPGKTVEISKIARDNLGWFYVVGTTDGSIFGAPQAGRKSAFVSKFDAFGGQHWTRIIGEADRLTFGTGIAVEADGSAVYISGKSNANIVPNGNKSGLSGFDAYIVKFDSNGVQLAADQRGNLNKQASGNALTISANNVFLAGYTDKSLDPFTSPQGARSAFILGYDKNTIGSIAPIISGYGGWNTLKTPATLASIEGLAPAYLPGFVFAAGTASGNYENTYNAGAQSVFLTKVVIRPYDFYHIYTKIFSGT